MPDTHTVNLVDQLTATFQTHPMRDRVPAVSVAVLAGDELVATAWGTDSDALFQAASISKPIAAMTALRLVARGHLDLDTDVNTWLKSWQLPTSATWRPTVTLRHILCHGAALTMSGYPGYQSDAPLPNLPAILDGKPPANTAPVRVDGIPGLTHRYSGGGFVVLQQLLEDVSGRKFAELATELVLSPAGMASATYRHPMRNNAAIGHVDGAPIPGGWYTYPEQAAAGLWCTPTDLAKFARAVQACAAGEPDALLPVELARDMLTAQVSGYGLGLRLEGNPPHQRFIHGGSNHGYQCALYATFAVGHAAAVMTNSDCGAAVIRSLIATSANATGWPDPPRFTSAELTNTETAESIQGRYPGNYITDRGICVRIDGTPEGGLLLTVMGQPALYMDLQTPILALVPAANCSIEFTLDSSGRPTSMTISQYGTGTTAIRE